MTGPQLTQYGPTSLFTADGANTFVQSCDTLATLRNFTPDGYGVVFAQGQNTPGDGSGGAFWFNPLVIGIDDNLNTIVPAGTAQGAWLRLPTVLIGTAIGNAFLVISASPGNAAGIELESGTSQRWTIQKSNAAETGGNAGSDFQIQRYSDVGNFLDNALFITRVDGVVHMPDGFSTVGGGSIGGGASVSGGLAVLGGETVRGGSQIFAGLVVNGGLTVNSGGATIETGGLSVSGGGNALFDNSIGLGFFGQSAAAQQTPAGNTTTPTAGAGATVHVDTTFTGGSGSTAFTIGDIVLALKNLGFLKM